jgi:hypothetical protein
MLSPGLRHLVVLVRTDDSEQRVASVFRVEKSGSEDGGDMLFRNVDSHRIDTA